MQTQLEKFRHLFQWQPGYKVLDITSHSDEISQFILNRLEEVSGRLAVVQYPGKHQEIVGEGELKLQEVTSFDMPFRALPRDNDVVVIRDVLQHHSQLDNVLSIAYRTLANAGEIIVMTQKDTPISNTIYDALDKAEFRATNTIDIFDAYELIMAKKMHMWGNGL